MSIVATRKFSKKGPRTSIRQKKYNRLQRLSVPRSISTGYGFASRRASMGFPDVVRTTLRYHDSTIKLNPGIGTTAVHVFRLNR